MDNLPFQAIRKECDRLAIQPTEHCIYVSIGEKKLYLLKNQEIVKVYPTAFGINPPSCIENSLGTPTGLHTIAEKIGDGAESGMVFKGRVPTGKKYWEYADDSGNKVVTRILWLRGLEPGVNLGDGCDTFNRYIYIHGTNQEADFENAKSHGCVLLINADVIELFDLVPCDSIVAIEK